MIPDLSHSALIYAVRALGLLSFLGRAAPFHTLWLSQHRVAYYARQSASRAIHRQAFARKLHQCYETSLLCEMSLSST